MTKKEKLIETIKSVIGFIKIKDLLTLALAVFIMIELFYPTKVIEYNADLLTTKESYAIGEDIFYIVDFCKFKPYKGNLKVRIVGVDTEYNKTIRQFDSNVESGCVKNKFFAGTVPIDTEIQAGTYILRTTASYEKNSFRQNLSFYNVSNEFKVERYDIIEVNNKEIE